MNGFDQAKEHLMSEIHNSNLNYLMLAQQMILMDKTAAIYRLGVSQDVADILESLSNSQIIKLASSSVMLMRFRFDDASILGMLTNNTKGHGQTLAHSAIIMADQKVETIA